MPVNTVLKGPRQCAKNDCRFACVAQILGLGNAFPEPSSTATALQHRLIMTLVSFQAF